MRIRAGPSWSACRSSDVERDREVVAVAYLAQPRRGLGGVRLGGAGDGEHAVLERLAVGEAPGRIEAERGEGDHDVHDHHEREQRCEHERRRRRTCGGCPVHPGILASGTPGGSAEAARSEQQLGGRCVGHHGGGRGPAPMRCHALRAAGRTRWARCPAQGRGRRRRRTAGSRSGAAPRRAGRGSPAPGGSAPRPCGSVRFSARARSMAMPIDDVNTGAVPRRWARRRRPGSGGSQAGSGGSSSAASTS